MIGTMKTNAMQKLNVQDGQSADLVADNIATLKYLFPEILSENKIDFAALKQLLGGEVSEAEERYNFNWNGKARARRLAQTPSTGTLRPSREESKNWDNTQNLFIEGDNLEVLKLLQKSYHQRVKMIYIDPPYNTGKDFIYPDDYRDNIRNYLELTGQTDEEGKKLSVNAEIAGRYHTNWLNMMYPRLKLARNLLRDDGVIFVSIDDVELTNLRLLMNEIYGEENFLSCIIWQHSLQPKGYSDRFSVHHNYILCYRKTGQFELNALDRTEEHNKNYSNPDNDPRGAWRPGDVRNALYRPNLIYRIKTPSGNFIDPPENGWRWSKETVAEKISTGEIVFGKDETRIIRKIYLATVEGRAPETIWFGKDVGTTRDAISELKELFDQTAPFDTPKPSSLILKMMEIAGVNERDIVLDFFSGSASTAQAVIRKNSIDGANRKFVLVQLPEPTDNPDYPAITDIGKERIRRAGEKIRADNAGKPGTVNLDIGFKAFKLDSSNLKPWDADFDTLAEDLLSAADVIKPERSAEDVLFEILLKYGLDLSLPIQTHTLAGKTVYEVGAGGLIACLEDGMTEAVAKAIGQLNAHLQPEVCRVVFKDAGFSDDAAKLNAVQVLKQFGIDDVKSI
jgi:adenine-specific DNA-methyltransferase